MEDTGDAEDVSETETRETPHKRRARPRAIAPGTHVDRYVILETLGQGGAGFVYGAYDPKLDRKVALKVLHDRSDEELRERLLREAQAMARVAHPNVVAVFDTGVIDGQAFIAMECVQGATLREWQRERPWADRLSAYLQAGNGLAAAHNAGLVHRDFKPENVLVSQGGEIKVTDFGIVHTLNKPRSGTPAGGQSSLEGVTPSGSTPVTRMTEDGVLVGTPGYMAPEQYGAEVIDARTDQFAFCVSLYEALYGEKPFAAASRTLADVMSATLKGEVRPPPKGTKVPPYLHAVLARGLRPEQEHRYPSMRALLDALRRDPAQARRRGMLVAGVGAVAALGAAALVRMVDARGAREQAVCAGAETEVAETWNPQIEAQVERALLATNVPYAADTWRRLRDEIDRTMASWVGMYRQTCEATRLHQTQTETVMTARMSCLERRRDKVGALVRMLTNADRDMVSRALPAVRELPSLDECKDAQSLTAIESEPSSSPAQTEIAAIRRALAEVETALDLERFSAARSQIEPLVAHARTVNYRPLLAQVLLASSRAKAVDAGSDAWLTDATEAVSNADVGRADRLRAEAATWVTVVLANNGRIDAAEQWAWFADAALRRAGDPPPERAAWFDTIHRLRYNQGRHRDSVAAARQAFDLGKSAGVAETIVAEYERALAQGVADLGDIQMAEALIEDADRIAASAFGEEHPRRVRFLGAASYVYSLANDTQRGLDYLRRTVALGERVSPESPYLATIYANTCWLLYGTGDLTAALASCEKAVESSLRIEGAASIGLAYAYRDRADVLRALHRFPEADADYLKAIEIHERGSTKVPNYVYALGGLGQSRLQAGRANEAVPLLERAMDASAVVDMKSHESEAILANTQFALARALVQTGKASGRAGKMARDAAAAFDDAGRPDSAREVTTWLKEHGL